MSQSFQLKLKTSIFDKERIFILDPEFIEFDNTNLIVTTPARISKLEVAEIRYGVKAIRGYRFRIGRIYCIDIKSITGSIIKLRLKSIYRINRMQLEVKYKQILQGLFENFMNDICHNYIQKFNKKEDFSILGVTFMQEAVLFEKENKLISWIDLGTKNYWSYYSIFSITNPHLYKTFQYVTDWNASILRIVSRYILKNKEKVTG